MEDGKDLIFQLRGLAPARVRFCVLDACRHHGDDLRCLLNVRLRFRSPRGVGFSDDSQPEARLSSLLQRHELLGDEIRFALPATRLFEICSDGSGGVNELERKASQDRIRRDLRSTELNDGDSEPEPSDPQIA